MGFFKLTIRDVPLDNQTVLLRVDYNVPLTEKGEISDDLRIKASLPTLEYLLERSCKIVIISHLGRPKGRDDSLSLEPVAVRLSELLERKVNFVDDVIGDKVYQAVKNASNISVTLLENLRYYKEEEANDLDFAKKLSKSTGAKYFIQDGFGVVHMAHASTDAITLCLPSVAGLLVEKEYRILDLVKNSPEHPLVAVFGGAKIEDKIPLIKQFVSIADKIIIGGAIANAFLSYKGVRLGASMVEGDQEDEIAKVYEAAGAKVGGNVDDFIVLPIDLAVASKPDKSAERRVVGIGDLNSEDLALDIGDRSIERVVNEVESAKTVFWNGTLGIAEIPAFAHGSARLALALATNPDIKTVIGGGDTADFVTKWDGGGGKSFYYVSTGGGACLDLLTGNKLPGIEGLLDARK